MAAANHLLSSFQTLSCSITGPAPGLLGPCSKQRCDPSPRIHRGLPKTTPQPLPENSSGPAAQRVTERDPRQERHLTKEKRTPANTRTQCSSDARQSTLRFLETCGKLMHFQNLTFGNLAVRFSKNSLQRLTDAQVGMFIEQGKYRQVTSQIHPTSNRLRFSKGLL